MTTRILPLRVTPIPGWGARHMLERNFLVYRRLWLVIFSGFFEPVFYLFSIGIGLGALVGDLSLPDGRAISYAAFVAPALLGASAMNGAVYESTFNIFFKLKYEKVYDAVLATPMKPVDVAIGEIAWSLIRGFLYAAGFLAVMAFMGLATSPLALLALPATVLIGFSFAAAGMAATTFMRGWQDFDMVGVVTLPLFLFSATFYPLDVYPPIIQQLTKISPLYHGVELIRGLTLGNLDAGMFGHIAFLVTMGAVAATIASRRIGKLLLP